MYLHKWELTLEEFAEISNNDFYKIHQTVWDLFGNKHTERKFLYRVIVQKNIVIILIRGSYPVEIKPSVGNMYSKVFNDIKIKGLYQLSATLNPVIDKSRMDAGKKNSTRVPLVHEQDINEWLTNIMLKKGFSVKRVLINHPYKLFSKMKGKGNYISVCDVQGVVEAFDEAKALEAFENGVGKERAFGCGMLCLSSIGNATISSDDNEDCDD